MEEVVVKMELRLTVAALAAVLPLLSAGAAQTIKFGPQPGLTSGNFPFTETVPDGYAGFNWHGAIDDEFLDTTSTGFGSAYITEMSRTAAFDLDSMVMQNLESDIGHDTGIAYLETEISGYFNGSLVETVTRDFTVGGDRVLHVNMDGVNDIKFSTTEINTGLNDDGTRFGPPGPGPDLTLVSQMTVDNFSGVAKAPELDPAATASAVTLLFGSLLVISGRRVRGKGLSR
jgi:hypothetical protein